MARVLHLARLNTTTYPGQCFLWLSDESDGDNPSHQPLSADALVEACEGVCSVSETVSLYRWNPDTGKATETAAMPINDEALIALLEKLHTAEESPWQLAPETQCMLGLVRIVGYLIAHQKVLPHLKRDNDEYISCWLPLLDINWQRHLYQLSRQCPQVWWSFHDKDMQPPPVDVYRAFFDVVSRWVDIVIRSENHEYFLLSLAYRKSQQDDLPADDAWSLGLRTRDNILDDKNGDWAAYAKSLSAWQHNTLLEHAPAFRLSLRLEEPVNPEEAWQSEEEATRHPWRLRLLIQPFHDASLNYTLSEYETELENQTIPASPYGVNWRDTLWHTLESIRDIIPQIFDCLDSGIDKHDQETPSDGFTLNTQEAFMFLTEKAFELQERDIALMLPSWWTPKGARSKLGLKANVHSSQLRSAADLSLDKVVEFDWQMAIGGEDITGEELEALAKTKIPLVYLKGRWIQVDEKELQAGLNFWEKKTQGMLNLRDLLRMRAGVTDEFAELPIEAVNASGWVADTIRQLEGHEPCDERQLPSGLNVNLRPYQERGFHWLHYLSQLGLGACLADDMGLGKTIQALTLVLSEWQLNQANNTNKPVLLVCPTSVINNWRRESERFTPDLPLSVHHGVDRLSHQALIEHCENKALIITSYAILQRDITHLKKINWGGVILDEAQNIKNPETKQAKASRMLTCDFRIALTGTPVENNVGDLWSIMEYLNPGFLGSQAAFRRQFLVPIQQGSDPGATERLKKLTMPFFLRRLKTDKSIIDDLPEKQEYDVFTTLTAEQAALYQAVIQETNQQLEIVSGIQRKGLILATLTKLKKICNHPAHFLADNSAIEQRSGKVSRLLEMLEVVLSVNEKSLIFTQFVDMGDILQRHLSRRFNEDVLFLHGGVAKGQRDAMVDHFQEENGPRMFILSLKAGGTGLNLTAANHVFHFDRWWNPAVENQATDRAFRIGQTRNVQVHKLICAGTLEEKIADMIQKKQRIAQDIFGSGEGWISTLDNQALRDVLALQQESVEV